MFKNIHIKTIFFILLFLVINVTKAQEKKWQSISSPVFSDLKKIQFINKDSAFISGKQLLLLTANECVKFPIQPPCEISNFFAIHSKCIFVCNTTPYQNSDLFHWDGKKWTKINNPMANNINDMYFDDAKNGLLASYGEIAQMIAGQWRHITPPDNRVIYKILKTKENEIIVLTGGKGIYKYTDKWVYIKHSLNTFYLSKAKNKIYTIGNDFLGVIDAGSIKILSKDPIWSKVISVTENFDNEIIGVGSDGTILIYKDNKITPIKSPTQQRLTQITAFKKSLICVGNEGTILKYTHEKIISDSKTWKGFENISFNSNAKVIDDEYGVITADFNNDGLTDIFTCGLFEEEHLYINQNNFKFSEQSKAFHLNQDDSTNKELHLGACAGDIDNDGYIDLYLGVLNGKNKIYKNIKGKYFINYSYNTGGIGKATDRTNACIMGDVDNDGDIDIFITNEYSSNCLFLNNGVGIFNEVTTNVGLETTEGGNAATFGDIDQDGDLDLYVTNWSSKNILYKNLFVETGKLQFENITKKSLTGGKSFTKSNAVIFTDIDNDADLDLFITNRKSSNKLYINNGKGVFSDQTVTLIGADTDASYGAIIADFDGDSYKDIYLSNVGENVFYKNKKGVFKKKTLKYDANIAGYSTGSALADFDKDGSLDMYIANYVGVSSALLRNKKENDNFIRLQVSGYQNNRNAIGAKIYIYSQENPPKLLWFDEIRTGSGYVSQNDFEKIISIQDNKKVDITILFPNGVITKDSTTSGNTILISDVKGFAVYYFQFKQLIKRMFLDPHHLFELIKWVFILFLISISGFYQYKKHEWNLWVFLGAVFLFFGLYYLQYQRFQYSPFLFSTFLPLSSMLIGVLLTYYYFERKYIKKEAEKEKNRIKTKLSRDLHDDLAATVSSIGFYLTLMKFDIKEKSPKILSFINKSEDLVIDATNAITDMIWSVNPKQETLKSLLIRIQKNYQELFNENKIHLSIPIADTVLNRKLNDTVKQNIYLIIKETLNNILKYAQASEVNIKVVKKGKQTELVITDNGIGFDYSSSLNKGHGLINIKNRAEEIQADFIITSKNLEGTTIIIIF